MYLLEANERIGVIIQRVLCAAFWFSVKIDNPKHSISVAQQRLFIALAEL